ncbi:MAG: hypothetical protein Q8M03_08425, partial [Legionella sp.]|nr:hypothetical protein [Legionella sp.]
MSLVDDVEAPLSYSSAPFYSPIALDDAVPFAKLTNHQVDQLGEARGTRYHCPIANRYQSPAMYPVVTSSALSLLKKDSTINAVSLQLKLLQHLGFDVTGDTFSTEKLLSIQWTRAFLQAIADLYNVLVIVYLENGTNSKQSRFLFITPKPVPTPSSPFMLTLKDDLEIINPKPDLVADRQNALPMVLVQTASSLVFLYRTSLNKDLNSALTVAERNEHNRSRVPAEYAIWPVPPLVRRTHDMDLHAFYVPEDPSGGVFSTGFEYTVKGTEVNNVPQTVAAALVVTPSSVYTDRTLYNFMEMRIITSVAGDKNEGRPLIFDRLNNFIPFTAADLAVLSNHYRVTILVKHVSTQHLPLYAVFTPKKKSLFTIHLVQEKNFFTLVMPQEIPQAGLDAYNSVFTEAERSSPEFLSTLGSTYLPDIIKNNPTVIHTQIVPLFKPVLAQSRQEAPSTFPVCSSSSSLHTKAVPDNPADSCEIVVLEDDSSIPTVSPITENVNSRQYLHAKNPLFSIPLADNFPSVSQ